MNRWDKTWRSIDRARLVIRIMLFVVFFALFEYVWFVTDRFFGVVETAQLEDNPQWAAMVPILGAITAFAGANVKFIVDLAMKMWTSWSSGGTDWGKTDDQNGD